MASSVIFEQKIQNIVNDYDKYQRHLEEEKRINIARVEEKRNLYNKFQNHLDEHSLKKLLDGKLCILCHRNTQLKHYTKQHVIQNNIYCDEHGDLMLEHRPVHPESTNACEKCAILDCPFRNPDHNNPPSNDRDETGCPDCYEAYY